MVTRDAKNLKLHVGIIGAGVMGSMLARRLIVTNTLRSSQIFICDRNSDKLKKLRENYKINISLDKEEVIKKSEILVLAVKPQDFRNLAEELQKFLIKKSCLIISIMAGVDIKTIQALLCIKTVVRVMPNLPAQIGFGVSVWKSAKEVSVSQKKCVRDILQSLGREIELNKESDIDKATAISGSGPAYVFLFQELFHKAAMALGLNKKLARELVMETVWGAVSLERQTKIEPDILRCGVTSKGGTTAAAVKIFTEQKFDEIFKQALRVAFDRAQELKKV